MPKIYRVMRKDVDGKPVVDASGKGLGVRDVPVNNRADVDLDQIGYVMLNGGGMSVAPHWRDLPPFRVPKRLKAKFPDARGAPDLHCFTMGDGPFRDGPVTDDLDLKQDSPQHGVVAPHVSVPIDQYQLNLASTRDLWIIDEA